MLDPFPTIEQIRQSSCPVAHTERWGGSWMPTRYADIVAVAQEHDVFTSRQILVTGPPDGQEPEGAYAGVAAPPISSDPPEHHWHRRLILPFFAPQAEGRIIRAYLEPQPDDDVPRFPYEDHLHQRARHPPCWPAGAPRISPPRLTHANPRARPMRRAPRRRAVNTRPHPGAPRGEVRAPWARRGGRTWAGSAARLLSELYVAEGLK